jgi:hypothetical protein
VAGDADSVRLPIYPLVLADEHLAESAAQLERADDAVVHQRADIPDTELGQWIADGEALDSLSDEFRVVAQDVCVLFEYGRTDPRLDEASARGFVDERRCVALGWERRELQNGGVKDDSQGRAWRVEEPVRVAWLRRTQPGCSELAKTCFTSARSAHATPEGLREGVEGVRVRTG